MLSSFSKTEIKTTYSVQYRMGNIWHESSSLPLSSSDDEYWVFEYYNGLAKPINEYFQEWRLMKMVETIKTYIETTSVVTQEA